MTILATLWWKYEKYCTKLVKSAHNPWSFQFNTQLILVIWDTYLLWSSIFEPVLHISRLKWLYN